MDNVQRESRVVSVMTNLHKETCAVVRDRKGRSSSPAPNSKAKTDEWEQIFLKKQTKKEALQTKKL